MSRTRYQRALVHCLPGPIPCPRRLPGQDFRYHRRTQRAHSGGSKELPVLPTCEVERALLRHLNMTCQQPTRRPWRSVLRPAATCDQPLGETGGKWPPWASVTSRVAGTEYRYRELNLARLYQLESGSEKIVGIRAARSARQGCHPRPAQQGAG